MSKQRKQYVIVEHRRPDFYDALIKKNEDLKRQNVDLKRRITELETKYGYEVYLNIELCDLLNAHDIPYRKYLDVRERQKMEIR